ncbi:hypothetical protein ACS0TY_001860 [Phlomoides rotata]
MVLIHNGNGSCCTKIAYNTLRQASSGLASLNSASAAFKKIWKAWTPKKLITTAWRLLRERLPTKDNLIKRDLVEKFYKDTLVKKNLPKLDFASWFNAVILP